MTFPKGYKPPYKPKPPASPKGTFPKGYKPPEEYKPPVNATFPKGYIGLIVFIFTIVIITIFFIIPTIQSNTTKYSQYSNNALDMSIRYPKSWVYHEFIGNALGDMFSTEDYQTVFYPSSEVSFMKNLSSSPDVYVQIGKQRDLPYKNMPLDLYFDYAKKFKINQGYNITKAGKTNLTDGTPAYELDVSNTTLPEKAIIVYMNKNPESYYFTYTAPPEKFNSYLPIALQMFKTLSFKYK